MLEFFETSGRNLLAAEAAAGVRHHVAPSIVGTDRTPDNRYFRAKVAQEKLIETSGIPYTIIRSTVDHCCYAWNTLIDQPWKIMSIARRDWAIIGQSLCGLVLI